MNEVFALFVGVGTLLLYWGMAVINLWIARRYANVSLRQLKQEEERRNERQEKRFYERWLKKNKKKIAKCWRTAFIEVLIINVLEYYLMTTFWVIGTCVGFFMSILSGVILLSIIINLLKKESKIFDNIGEKMDIVLVCVPIMSLGFLFPINSNGWMNLGVFLVIFTNVEMAFLIWVVLNMNSQENLEQELGRFLSCTRKVTQRSTTGFRSRKRTNKAAAFLK